MTKSVRQKIALAFFIAASLGGLFACSGLKETPPKSAEEAFQRAMKLFKDEDYLEARPLFDAIKIQYPASPYADDAQYYLAECYFRNDEYILAAFNYNMVRRQFPNSEYYKKSLFKTALCYYELSPPWDRDQEYTRKAISTFNDYTTIYAGDSLSKIAEKYIKELRNKLGKREYETAELYMKLRSPNSALIYYQSVIDNYYDTKYYEAAYLGKIKSLIKTRKYDKAKSAIASYFAEFRGKGKLNSEAEKLSKELRELKEKPND